jgi:hypothetical protein
VGDARDRRYAEIVAFQLEANPETWAELRRHGVDEETELRLDFLFWAPSREAAEKLRAHLIEETDYDIATRASDDEWVVEGTTQPTTVSLEILDAWVRKLTAIGLLHGDCTFDGWGAQVP